MRLSSGLADPDPSPSAEDEEGEPECPAYVKEAPFPLGSIQMAEEGDETAGLEIAVGEGHFSGRGMAEDHTAPQRAETAAAEGTAFKACLGRSVRLGDQHAEGDPILPAVKHGIGAGHGAPVQAELIDPALKEAAKKRLDKVFSLDMSGSTLLVTVAKAFEKVLAIKAAFLITGVFHSRTNYLLKLVS